MKSENAHLFKNAENSLLTFIKNPETYVPQKVTNTCIVGLEILHLREKMSVRLHSNICLVLTLV